MDGVFMGKTLKIICLLLITIISIFVVGILQDKAQLSRNVIRLHVVANSDSEADQARKLLVKDAVMNYLQADMTDINSSSEAVLYLRDNLQAIEAVAEDTLNAAGCDDAVQVTLARESFDTRQYDDFALPAGVYNALRIRIGDAQGKNWWCVVFPSLCMSVTDENMDVSVFSDTLSDTIRQEKGYEVRFFLMDWLGELEKFLFWG